jgi:recombinational DNA repair protein (RecF pathway)
MKTKIEGILLRKIPFQERHLICHILLRSGQRISVLFYGGQGGGKKAKATQLELGYLLRIELGRSKSTEQLYRAKEYQVLWNHQKVRYNHKAFYLMCFFLEVTDKMAQEEDLHDQNFTENAEGEGPFRVLSNALVHLERSLETGNFKKESEFFIFFGKLLVEHGVFPERERCCLCEEELVGLMDLFLVPDHGGFSCSSCINREEYLFERNGRVGRETWELLGKIGHQQYQEIGELSISNNAVIQLLFHYFSYQFHYQKNDFQGLKLVL